VLRRKILRDFWFEYALCLMLQPKRLSLPVVELEDIAGPIPGIRIERMPRGLWSSPVVDLITMARVTAAIKPRRALELGSFRGYTAAAIAEHLPQEGLLVTVDVNPQHGDVYQNTPLAARIERRVGTAREVLAADPDGSFDLVFIDADHRYPGVKADTETVLRLVGPRGWLLWHDYANWGYFSGGCGVPEYLSELSETLPVLHLAGTNLAVHSPYWQQPEGRRSYEQALARMSERKSQDPWASEVARP
jgi:hypothetical protein